MNDHFIAPMKATCHILFVQGDPFRTLFVSRLSYDVTDKKLRREFEEYGPIKRARIVTDKNGASHIMLWQRACHMPYRTGLSRG